jgi:hypothetical protein
VALREAVELEILETSESPWNEEDVAELST